MTTPKPPGLQGSFGVLRDESVPVLPCERDHADASSSFEFPWERISRSPAASTPAVGESALAGGSWSSSAGCDASHVRPRRRARGTEQLAAPREMSIGQIHWRDAVAAFGSDPSSRLQLEAQRQILRSPHCSSCAKLGHGGAVERAYAGKRLLQDPLPGTTLCAMSACLSSPRRPARPVRQR
jgi:hypothetical protein